MAGLRVAAIMHTTPRALLAYIAPPVDLYFCLALFLFFSCCACACTLLALRAVWFRTEEMGCKVEGYLGGDFGKLGTDEYC